MFEGFDRGCFDHNGVNITYVEKGRGDPVLLLHGFPQTHAMWARIAPSLAEHYHIICPDLRGYGASGKPNNVGDYSFRAMGSDQLALMSHLGHDRFHLVGHDRGARTAHRMALDAPDRIMSLSLLDIIPTHLLLNDLTQHVAKAYYHWFFMAQPEPMPETLIGADPVTFYESCLFGWGATGANGFDPEQMDAYRAAWRDRDVIRGMCNDYRAALEVDFHLDAADLGRRLAMPSCVMWGKDGIMGQCYDVAETWADRLENITPCPMPGGHFFPDQFPNETTQSIRTFLKSVS
jgi:haloacetate dehalogenase